MNCSTKATSISCDEMPKRLPIINYSLFLDMLVDGTIPVHRKMQPTPGRLPRAQRVCSTIPSLTRPGNMLGLAECYCGRWSGCFSLTVPEFCSTISVPLATLPSEGNLGCCQKAYLPPPFQNFVFFIVLYFLYKPGLPPQLCIFF